MAFVLCGDGLRRTWRTA